MFVAHHQVITWQEMHILFSRAAEQPCQQYGRLSFARFVTDRGGGLFPVLQSHLLLPTTTTTHHHHHNQASAGAAPAAAVAAARLV